MQISHLCGELFPKEVQIIINNNTNNGHEKLTFESLFRVVQESTSAV